MTKKHFEEIAKALKDTKASRETSLAVMNVCRSTYKGGYSFNSARFMNAYGHLSSDDMARKVLEAGY